MPATYTASLRLSKPAVGDTNWGLVVNDGCTNLTDTAIAGYTTVSMPSNADYTLTSSNGAADEARSMMLNITSAVSLTTTRNVICPSVSKLYFVKNATSGSQSIVFKTSAGAGITIPTGKTVAVSCNGTDVVNAFDYLAGVTFGGTISGTFSGAYNGTVGATTPNTGAFTTLSASSTVSGTGFSTYLASPPAIGGTAAAAGAFTTLSASSTVSGTGFSTYLASPPAIGGTAAAAGAFTTLSASSTVSGTGFSTYLASPPAIGGTAAAAGSFTTLSASSTVSGTGFSNYLASPPAIGGTTPAAGTFTSARTPSVAVTFSATAMTVNCQLSNVFTTTFTANVTTAPTISNAADGQTINWFITQDGTGGRTMTWPASFKWPGGSAGVLSTGANAADLLVATYRSSTGFWYATLSKGFA
jgi:hypothetical protein